MKIWDAATGEELFFLPPSHGDRAWGLAFSPDGHLLATSGGDQTAKLWALDREGRRGELLATLTGHNSTVSGVRFSPDGVILATAGGNETRLWDISGLDEAAPGTAVPNLLILPGDSPRFNTTSGDLFTRLDNLLRTFTLDNERLMELAESRVWRDFSAEECELYSIDPCPAESES